MPHKHAKNGEVPVRLIDLQKDSEKQVCAIPVIWPRSRVLRLDTHPVWSRDYNRICFNGAPGGRRPVFIGDLESRVISIAGNGR